jgi:hypothetical protein
VFATLRNAKTEAIQAGFKRVSSGKVHRFKSIKANLVPGA